MNDIEVLNEMGVVVKDASAAKMILDAIKALKRQENESLYRTNQKTSEITSLKTAIYCNKLLKEYTMVAFGIDESTMLMYNENRGLYQSMTYDIDEFINNQLPVTDVNITKHRKQVKDEIFRRCKKIAIEQLNCDKNLINFKNGLYNIEKNILLPHSKDVFSTIQANGNYNIVALDGFDGSVFSKYLETTFDLEVIPIIQEMLGYCISSYTEAHKMFFLEGTGGNGKSQFLEILNGMFNEKDISNVSINQLQKQEYAMELATSAFNSCGDIDSNYIANPGIIKQVTGGSDNERIMARTLYGKPVKFKPICKLAFSANTLPSSSDKGASWYDRLVIIPFFKSFRGQKGEIKNIGSMIAKSEIDIVLAWAIEGLQRLIKNNFKFSESAIINQKMKEYRHQNDNFSKFVDMYCFIDPGIKSDEYRNKPKNEKIFIPNSEIIELYKTYCEDNHEKMIGRLKIVSYLNSFGIHEKHTVLTSGRYFEGIAWTDKILEYRKRGELKGEVNPSIDNKHQKFEVYYGINKDESDFEEKLKNRESV